MSLWITLSSAFRFARRSVRLWPLGVLVMLGSGQLAVGGADIEDFAFASNADLHKWLVGHLPSAWAAIVAVPLAVVCLWLLSELAAAALMLASDARLEGRDLSAGEAWRGGLRVWRRVIAVDVLLVVPVLVPLVILAALGTAALDAGLLADMSARLLDAITVGFYSGFAVIVAIVVWAWRDLAVRHAVLGGARPMEAVHSGVADMTGSLLRTLALGASLFITSWLATLALLPLLILLDPLGLTGAYALTPSLVWQWVILPGAVVLGPYALFDVASWTYWYRLLHPVVVEVRDVR